ncbi:hypothetical protein RUM44_009824 [Polyplax serrata]|uniref:Uncharacterized protein n=1 Tax=Polyplax serrata TaxID=468196 RepID=A0ABR1AVI2_POLSC
MTNTLLSGFSSRYAEWSKRRHLMCSRKTALVCLWLLLMTTVRASAWEDGDDSVNVISVENMDALLGLRMVTELKSFEGVKTNDSDDGFDDEIKANQTETRYKRMLKQKSASFPASSHVSDLCSNTHCRCTIVRNEHLNVVCDFKNEEPASRLRKNREKNILSVLRGKGVAKKGNEK